MARLVRAIQQRRRLHGGGDRVDIVAIGWRELDAPRHAKRAYARQAGHDGMSKRVFVGQRRDNPPNKSGEGYDGEADGDVREHDAMVIGCA